jgi:hypothetical protein
MDLISRLFGTKPTAVQPDIPFGRFSDAYKSEAQQQAFDLSLEAFEQKEYLRAYQHLLSYLRDEGASEPNLVWQETEGQIIFELWQGSQRVTGTASAEKVRAESRIAKVGDLNVGFMRRLMESNFTLKFSRFALDPDNNLCIVFNSSASDGSPLKVMHALRELAIHADKQDDLLLGEFASVLSPSESRDFGEAPLAEKEAKYAYVRQSIEAAFAELDKDKPDPNTHPGAYAYLLLALAFRLDYLVRPEGFMMDRLEKVYSTYFSQSNLTPQVKLQQMRRELQGLLERPKEAFFQEIYRTRSTFGTNPAVPHGTVANLIEGELPSMDWSLQHNYEALALAVPQYIVGFTLFHQAPPKPDREYLHLFYQVSERAYFRSLGFDNHFADDAGRLQKQEILKEIKKIAERNRAEYPRLRPNTEKLDFASLPLFSKSYLLMIKDLDLSKE